MSIEPFFMLRMQACEERLRNEMAEEQITHPMEEYQPSSPHLEHLYEQMALAQRFSWPHELVFNV